MAGGSAWTAKNQDFSQFLTLDLGDIMNVTGIATQGRNSPKEYVMEYGISFGSNGLDYADYREVDGSTKVAPRSPSLTVTNAIVWITGRSLVEGSRQVSQMNKRINLFVITVSILGRRWDRLAGRRK